MRNAPAGALPGRGGSGLSLLSVSVRAALPPNGYRDEQPIKKGGPKPPQMKEVTPCFSTSQRKLQV